MIINSKLEQYEAFIRALPIRNLYLKEDLLVPELCMASEREVKMYYAPHNEFINPLATIMIVGITPGWNQMEVSLRTAKLALKESKSVEESCREAKLAARFAGSMRSNLTHMLNELNLHTYFGLADSEALFDAACPFLHTTSLLRYPVFINTQNYNGHKPELRGDAFLYNHANRSILSELQALNHIPLVIPLGKSVEMMFRRLLKENLVDEKQILWGFPHPSGANGHRLQQFKRSKDELEKGIADFIAS